MMADSMSSHKAMEPRKLSAPPGSNVDNTKHTIHQCPFKKGTQQESIGVLPVQSPKRQQQIGGKEPPRVYSTLHSPSKMTLLNSAAPQSDYHPTNLREALAFRVKKRQSAPIPTNQNKAMSVDFVLNKDDTTITPQKAMDIGSVVIKDSTTTRAKVMDISSIMNKDPVTTRPNVMDINTIVNKTPSARPNAMSIDFIVNKD
ncbi:uncharacterized protein GGS25DRAFT_119584 [Hypoxylon fragiforme]|uniref:uncharacterized protein n=1 Tax=Hypoxylon fragiforme TaxID=63214 RepID=UPI0020C5FA19|nr:uncharacterized protein GGS25DRAFT_119584 [Hypoxylon fragiforme]KAI2612440.1 hypothetical protein GGS25DRAFT_119584 [Hypoxylon fragiforme]